MSDEAKKYTVISLFSGAGGIDIGLHQTGRFRTLAALEFNSEACETLKANRDRLDNCEVIQADLSNYDPNVLLKKLNLKQGEVDLLVGGPPCQTYSFAGKREGLKSERGKLINSYRDFVLTIRPKMFLFENVKGFVEFPFETRHGHVPLVSEYVRAFMKDGLYNVQGWLLNAKNFGSPQNRERIFLIGNQLGCVVKTPHAEFGPPEVAASGHCKPWRTLQDAIGDLKSPSGESIEYPPSLKRVFELIPKGGGNWEDLPAGHPLRIYKKGGDEEDSPEAFWRRLRWDQLCPTITTKTSERFPGFCHPSETRPLSIREAARIQGFPDDWIFCGSKLEKYRQVGNAVPSPLAAASGLVIAAALDRAGSAKPKKEKWKGVFQIEWKKEKLRYSLVGMTMPGGGTPLSEPEKLELRKLEIKINRHISSYMACGEALIRINKGRLYRETHKTFEDYCIDKFGIERARAYQWMSAFEITKNVNQWSTNEEQPVNERQVRPLRLLEGAKDRAKAWDDAVKASRMAGSQKVSGEIVEQIVFEMLGRGKKPAKINEEERIHFSLMGNRIELQHAKEVPNDSVINTFYISCGDVENLIKQAEDGRMEEDDRDHLLVEVRKNAEELLALVEHVEWSVATDNSAELQKRRKRLFARHGISPP